MTTVFAALHENNSETFSTKLKRIKTKIFIPKTSYADHQLASLRNRSGSKRPSPGFDWSKEAGPKNSIRPCWGQWYGPVPSQSRTTRMAEPRQAPATDPRMCKHVQALPSPSRLGAAGLGRRSRPSSPQHCDSQRSGLCRWNSPRTSTFCRLQCSAYHLRLQRGHKALDKSIGIASQPGIAA